MNKENRKNASMAKPRKRRCRRRRGPGLLIPFFCLTLACAAVLTAVTIFFKVKTVEAVGETRYSKQEIVQAAGIETGENLIFINKIAAINRIFDGRPYLDEVSVRRRLPDTVEIYVTECAPAAALPAAEGQYWLMDKKGKLLELVSAEETGGLCAVVGLELQQPEAGSYADFLDKEKEKALFTILNTATNSDILEEIINIDINQIFEIRLRYTERFVVELGTVEDLTKKIGFLKSVVERLGEMDTGVIDLTNPQTARFRPE